MYKRKRKYKVGDRIIIVKIGQCTYSREGIKKGMTGRITSTSDYYERCDCGCGKYYHDYIEIVFDTPIGTYEEDEEEIKYFDATIKQRAFKLYTPTEEEKQQEVISVIKMLDNKYKKRMEMKGLKVCYV